MITLRGALDETGPTPLSSAPFCCEVGPPTVRSLELQRITLAAFSLGPEKAVFRTTSSCCAKLVRFRLFRNGLQQSTQIAHMRTDVHSDSWASIPADGLCATASAEKIRCRAIQPSERLLSGRSSPRERDRCFLRAELTVSLLPSGALLIRRRDVSAEVVHLPNRLPVTKSRRGKHKRCASVKTKRS